MRAANVSWNQGNQRAGSLSDPRRRQARADGSARSKRYGIIVDGVNYAYNALT